MAWWLLGLACWLAVALLVSLLIGGVCSRVHETDWDEAAPETDDDRSATGQAAEPVAAGARAAV